MRSWHWTCPDRATPEGRALTLLIALKALERVVRASAARSVGSAGAGPGPARLRPSSHPPGASGAGRSDDPARSGVQWLEVPHPAASRAHVRAGAARGPGARARVPPGWPVEVATLAGWPRAMEGLDAVRAVARREPGAAAGSPCRRVSVRWLPHRSEGRERRVWMPRTSGSSRWRYVRRTTPDPIAPPADLAHRDRRGRAIIGATSAHGGHAMEQERWTEVDRYLDEVMVGQTRPWRPRWLMSPRPVCPPSASRRPLASCCTSWPASIGARRILEVGTLGGYSTIWMARAVPAGGRVVSLEIDPRNAAVAAASIERAGCRGPGGDPGRTGGGHPHGPGSRGRRAVRPGVHRRRQALEPGVPRHGPSG